MRVRKLATQNICRCCFLDKIHWYRHISEGGEGCYCWQLSNACEAFATSECCFEERCFLTRKPINASMTKLSVSLYCLNFLCPRNYPTQLAVLGIAIPDQPYHNLRASKSVNRRFWATFLVVVFHWTTRYCTPVGKKCEAKNTFEYEYKWIYHGFHISFSEKKSLQWVNLELASSPETPPPPAHACKKKGESVSVRAKVIFWLSPQAALKWLFLTSCFSENGLRI